MTTSRTLKINTAGASLLPAFSRAVFLGHSYGEGTGASSLGQRFTSKIARSLHAEEVNYAHSGGILAFDDDVGIQNQPGGYATVLNAVKPTRPDPSAANPNSRALRTAQPYIPMADLFVIMYGANDVRWLNANVANGLVAFKAALRTAIRRCRAGGLFENTDPSWAYTGTWSARDLSNQGANAAAFASAGGWHQTGTIGDSATWTCPADFPGGEVVIGSMAYSARALVNVLVDGAAWPDWDFRDVNLQASNGKNNGVSLSLNGLSAGAHTIKLTFAATGTGAAGNFAIDYAQITAPDLPLVVLVNQPYLPANWAGGTHDPVVNADIDQYNAAIAAVAAEFTDGMVVVADVAARFVARGGSVLRGQPASLYTADAIHPDDRGMGTIAEVIEETVLTAPKPRAVAASALTWRPILPNANSNLAGTPAPWPNGTEMQWAIGWQAFTPAGWPPMAEYAKGPGGLVSFRGTAQKNSAPVADEAMLTQPLPNGFRPLVNQNFRLTAAQEINAAAFTQGAVLRVKSDGTLRWEGGGAQTPNWIDLSGISYYADG